MQVERSASSSSADVRATKRKLDDAFHKLDAAVASKETLVNQPPPAKKPLLARSIYSTLAKYGIKTKESDSSKNSLGTKFGPLSKSTPHLTAILSRAASRRRNPFAGQTTPAPSLSPLADYRPSSIPSFLNRLSTFKLSTYANKPPQIDAVAAAKCGWINDGKDRLVCGICNVSWVVANKDGMSRDAANTLIEKQRVSLVEAHKNGCPWKTRQCDDLIYRIPLQSSAFTVRELKINAMALDHLVQSVEIKHPLTPNQVASLESIISSVDVSHGEEEPIGEASSGMASHAPDNPSTTAILVSLFGWTPAPERPRTTSSRSVSRMSTTPSLSRASSVAPGNATPRPNLLRNASSKAASRDTSLLHCVLCQRRVGLWAFAPPPPPGEGAADAPEGSTDHQRTPSTQKQRQFDLLKEHRSYCPYVVRSTPLPALPVVSPSTTSLPTPSHTRSSSSASQVSGISGANGGLLEGWRAVLTVALRYKMTQRYQLGRRQGGEGGDSSQPEGEAMEVDFEAMVEGVKTRGGKDLLRYVKGLLG
ncbi:hypothetical protein VNI00_001190 [Paramarasmius palmivorus]|uniref:Zf-C3HC-domain-containing protein n=1 Tax=Paramarasmius palmivorus TaxID=297713 RepID=A0AAW0E630_9AGAR